MAKYLIYCLVFWYPIGLWAVIYRWQQAASTALFKKLLVFTNFAYTLLVLNYSCIGFLVSFLPFLYYIPDSMRIGFVLRQLTSMTTNLSSFLPHMLQVLSLHETLAAYGSVYYIGTILPIVLILLGNVIKPAKPSRSKARKEQWGENWRHLEVFYEEYQLLIRVLLLVVSP